MPTALLRYGGDINPPPPAPLPLGLHTHTRAATARHRLSARAAVNVLCDTSPATRPTNIALIRYQQHGTARYGQAYQVQPSRPTPPPRPNTASPTPLSQFNTRRISLPYEYLNSPRQGEGPHPHSIHRNKSFPPGREDGGAGRGGVT